jgi:large subunit ribosomal protein L3
MITGLIGRKVGMTQIYDKEHRAVPVTVIEAGPCVVVQVKTKKKDGYEAAQVGLLEGDRKPRLTKARSGHLTKNNIPPVRILREFSFENGAPEPGQKLTVDMFKDIRYVDVSGQSKGRGFAGVVRRWSFGGGAGSHGSMFHRAPGSIGASSFPSRVIKGMRMAGRYGNERVTVQSLRVAEVDSEKNLILVHGAVPGHRGAYVFIRKARKK